jgi:hypothetical protein
VNLRSAIVLVLLLVLYAVAGCEPRVAGLVVEDARFFKQADGAWVADVDVTAVEATGGSIGRHCVSAHYFAPGAGIELLAPAPAYGGLYEYAITCFDGGMRDGDVRTVRLVGKRTDIPLLARVRVQGQVARDIAVGDFTAR